MTAESADGMLVEREAELDSLRAVVGEVTSLGTGRLVLIEGPPGIGKTRLLHQAAEIAAAAGLLELAARGSEVERDFAFGIVHQLLGRVRAPGGGHRKGAPAVANPAVDRVLAPGSAPGPAADVSYAVLHGLYTLVAALSEGRGLAIVVDDADWADRASLRFLGFLARRLDGLPVVLALTARTTRPGGSDDPLAELHREPRALLLAPAPLSESAVARLAAQRLGGNADPGLTRAVHEATGGNPFLVSELLGEVGQAASGDAGIARAGRELGSRRVASAVLHRVGGLGAAATELARATAVLGDGADLRVAAELAGIGRDAAVRAADDLAAADVLAPGQPLRFVHALVRTSIYEDIPAAARDQAHHRAAWLLAAAGAPTERAAAHLLRTRGSGDARALSTLRDAARAAIAQGAPESAIRYLERALVEPPPRQEHGEVLAELGTAQMLVDGDAARRHLAEAVRVIEDPVHRAEAAATLASALFFAGRTVEAADASQAAIEAVGDRSPELLRRLEAATLVAAVHDPALTELARDMAARVRERAHAGDVGDRALLALAAWCDMRAGNPRAVAEAQAALDDASLLERDNGGTPMLAGLTLALADRDDGLAAFERGLALAHEQGSVFAFACHKLFAGRTRHLRGDLAEAVADLSEGLRGTPVGIGAVWGESWLADVLLDLGDDDGAAAALARLEAERDPAEDAHWLWYFETRSKLLLQRGETRAGLEETLRCGRLLEALDGRNPAMVAWRSRAAIALAELGEDERARSLAAEEVELARAWGAPRALGTALRAAALTERDERRVELLEQAVQVLRPSPARLALAEALYDLGAELRRSGRRAAAQPPLREALELAARCGVRPLEARVREELVATGARPRRAALHGPESLTSAELRVARRAAAGMTNREIAAALFVTRKTVEYHLGNAYRKLGIGSRSELVAAIGEGSGPGR